MRGLPDPAASRAVLAGVSRYRQLEALPAVANNLPALAEALCSGDSWRLAPADCRVVAEPASLQELLEPVAQAAEEATDTLLVYFAGHGLLDDRGDLFFGLPGAQPGQGHTGVPYSLLRSAILHGGAERHVIVLDCCFSGRALGVMGTSMADQAEIDGSCLLAAAPEAGVALAPPGERYTAFTGELLALLANGIEGGGAWLDLDTVYRRLRAELAAKGRPLPQKRDRNTAGGLLLARNRAYRPWLPAQAAPAEPGAPADPAAAPGPPSGPRWPDPEAFDDAAEFIEGLGQVRATSGLSVRAVSERAPEPIAAGTISALLNRSTLPTTWRSTGLLLAACGLPEDQLARWQATWQRLRTAAPPPPPAQAAGAVPVTPERGWRTRLAAGLRRGRPPR
ncbi:caspase family protein [Kitasatospora sp. LaBMicrA B282]|uniref:caspase family protein n=1 Tax=Kitasatospora sp. LaBMicrA B282 TaxID=3420949 RepID=UPI003D1036C5